MKLEDIDQIQPLVEQLGYPASLETLRHRVADLLADTRCAALVAEVETRPIGMGEVRIAVRPRPATRDNPEIIQAG